MCPSKFVVYILLISVSANLNSESQAGQLHSAPSQRQDRPSDFQFLVTGGYRPDTNDLVKYTVSLRMGKPKKFFGDNHFCAGTIFSERAILTAAHCMFSK